MSEVGESGIGDGVGDTGLLLSVAAAAAGRSVNVALEGVALRTRTFSILELAVCGGGVNQRSLADALLLNPSQIVAFVDDLVSAGLVERRPDPADRRNRMICATEKGLRCYHEARALADEALDGLLGELDDDERATLHGLLRRVVSSHVGGR